MTGRHHARRVTAIGATAVLMWGTLALFTAWTGAVPPFQLVAISFAVAFLIGFYSFRLHGAQAGAAGGGQSAELSVAAADRAVLRAAAGRASPMVVSGRRRSRLGRSWLRTP